MKPTSTVRAAERVILMGLSPRPLQPGEDPLEELAALTEAAGGIPVGSCVQRAEAPHPRTYLGTGKVQELGEQARKLRANLLVADDDLTPAQVRSIEEATRVRTIDRSELILAIFAQRARSREARDQVELAQLEYLMPRLKGMWTHLERVQGGIGMRGPGEKQIEIDRRLLDRKVQALRERARQIQDRRDREVASRGREFSVALVGYTNVGKSSLMNRLTGAGVVANDRLFETLSTRTSRLGLPHGGSVVVSDTVGFIRKLPHHLVASFRATLAEAQAADLLLHVVDASTPDPEGQMAASEEVLRSLGYDPARTFVVANKIDRAPPGAVGSLSGQGRVVVAVSARTGEGMADLVAKIEEAVEKRRRTLTLVCGVGEGALLAALRRRGRILSEILKDEGRYQVRARIAPEDWFGIRSLARDTIRVRWKD